MSGRNTSCTALSRLRASCSGVGTASHWCRSFPSNTRTAANCRGVDLYLQLESQHLAQFTYYTWNTSWLSVIHSRYLLYKSNYLTNYNVKKIIKLKLLIVHYDLVNPDQLGPQPIWDNENSDCKEINLKIEKNPFSSHNDVFTFFCHLNKPTLN